MPHLDDHPLLSAVKPEPPKALINLALKNKAPRVALVNAGRGHAFGGHPRGGRGRAC